MTVFAFQAGACFVQMHNQAKSTVTTSLEKVQAAKEKKDQELAAAHQALEEADKKLQVCARPQNTADEHGNVSTVRYVSFCDCHLLP